MTKIRWESWAVLVVGGLGLILFAVQIEDRTPMLLYFTIWSAILTTISWPLVDAGGSREVTIAARAGAAGTVLAGVVYWGGLFPTYGAGRYLVTIAANVFVHALLPVAVIVRLVRGPERLSVRDELLTIGWPLLYLSFTGLLALAGAPSPYPFLRPDQGANLWVTVPIFIAIWYAIVFLLHGLVAVAGVRGAATPAPPEVRSRS